MIRIRVGNWRTHRNLDAAEIISDDGTILAVVAEPCRRNWQTGTSNQGYWWGSHDERHFRALLVTKARRQFPRARYIQIDPGRDNAEDIDLSNDRSEES